MQLRQSMRRAAKMRLALAGASGSGKTYSSLLIAYGMTGDWSKIAVIDSENCSADLYSHLGHYISYLIYNKKHWKIQTIKDGM